MTCSCCRGHGVVAAIDGRSRPCSRCRTDAFNLWSADRAVEHVMSKSDDQIIAEAGGPEAAARIAGECRAMFERVAAECGLSKPITD